MAISLGALFRGAARGVSAGYRGAEEGRQTARRERLDEQKLRRQAQMDALMAGLREAQTARERATAERALRPDRTPNVTDVTGRRVADVVGVEVPVTEPRAPLVTSPEGRRVLDVPGTQVAPPGGTGSAAIIKAVTENRGKLKVIDDALVKLQQRPQGVGVKGLIPDIVLQRTDPEGVALRAAIADIGSLVIHDRSGAAVTAAEMPRLEPFIPRDYDTPATLRTKLQRMKEIIAEETGFMEQNRQRSGEPPSPVSPRAGSPSRPATTGIPSRFLPGRP